MLKDYISTTTLNMSQCKGLTKTKQRCSRKTSNNEDWCWQHKMTNRSDSTSPKVAGGRQIGDLSLFQTNDIQRWEAEYQRIMDPKYAKNTRNFNSTLTGNLWNHEGDPPIFLIPRVRAGPSYKSIPLNGVSSDDVVYMSISKGYHGQDVSSFTLGPVVGEGLCLVNSAFSKSIAIMHIEGGGTVDYGRKNFWKRSKTPHRVISFIDDDHITVDGQIYDTKDWLRNNEHLWLDEWELWRRSVALSSLGGFDWVKDSPCIAYRYANRYIGFVEWKKECYIRPSYELLPDTRVFQYLWTIWHDYQRPLGLVHPKAISAEPEIPITRQYLRELYDSNVEMVCQPYVVAGRLLNVEI